MRKALHDRDGQTQYVIALVRDNAGRPDTGWKVRNELAMLTGNKSIVRRWILHANIRNRIKGFIDLDRIRV